MQRKVVSVILFVICLLISNVVYFQPAKAQYQQDITINIDGSISPSSAPIIQKDSTYTLTSDIKGRITISKSNIIFNGNQHTIDQYSPSPNEKTEFGIVLDQVYNVTVVNTTITNTGNGIWTLNRPTAGIRIEYGGSNVIMGNNVVNNYVAIDVFQSNDNTLTRNNFTNNTNPYGVAHAVMFWGSSNNKIYHNNFIDNKYPAGTGKFNSLSTNNTWNTEKEGNYWSDYNGTDNNSDAIGDTPYVIDENNQDNYPLIEPYVSPEYPSPPDEAPWAAGGFFPEPNAVNVSVDTTVSISFGRPPPIVELSITPEVAVKQKTTENVGIAGELHTFHFEEALEAFTTYNVTILFGAPNSTRTWKFTTGAGPEIPTTPKNDLIDNTPLYLCLLLVALVSGAIISLHLSTIIKKRKKTTP